MRKLIRWSLALVLTLIGAFAVSWVIAMPDRHERGVWQHEADGTLLTLSPLKAVLYHQTTHSCVADLSFPAHLALVKAVEGAWIEAADDRLELHIDGNLAPAKFTRIASLPEACHGPPDTAPAAIFDAVWTIMDEHYAFFDLHGVDWSARHALAPAHDEAVTDAALFERLKQALEGLDDGHVQLGAGEFGYFSPSVAPGWIEGTDLTRTSLNEIARQTIGLPLTPIAGTGLEYGLRDDGIGYVLITEMSTDPGFGQLGTALAAEAFGQVSDALRDATSILIDVRYNPGGDDGTAFAYASFFANSPTLALTKRTRNGDGWTEEIEATVEPAPEAARLTAPVYLLTSQLTGSGAEIFTMAMRELPQVTVLGENTGGGLSDILGTTLANGWQFGLSNQEYRTPDGTLYEGTGLPPDVAIPTDGAALLAGNDPVLQRAIEMAQP